LYLVTGSKTFISGGLNCDLVITAVKTDRTGGRHGISLLVVDAGSAGCSSTTWSYPRRTAAPPGVGAVVLVEAPPEPPGSDR